ncbi:MAG: hypothetical protein U1E36_03140 [Rickettsiales bacterium]
MATGASAQTVIGENEPYQKCIDLSKSNPTQALTYSERWINVESTPSSLHCRALVLFGQNHFDEAAKVLDRLGIAIKNASPRLRLGVYRQTARAWQRAGAEKTAIARLSDALDLIEPERNDAVMRREQVEILIERAMMYSHIGKPLDGIQDLDQALTLGIQADRILMTRAKIEAAHNQQDLAIRDVEAVLRNNPKNQEAQELLRVIVAKP